MGEALQGLIPWPWFQAGDLSLSCLETGVLSLDCPGKFICVVMSNPLPPLGSSSAQLPAKNAGVVAHFQPPGDLWPKLNLCHCTAGRFFTTFYREKPSEVWINFKWEQPALLVSPRFLKMSAFICHLPVVLQFPWFMDLTLSLSMLCYSIRP